MKIYDTKQKIELSPDCQYEFFRGEKDGEIIRIPWYIVEENPERFEGYYCKNEEDRKWIMGRPIGIQGRFKCYATR